MIVAETENLILRHFLLEDSLFILELLNTPGWLQFIGDRNVHSIIDAENYLLNGPIKSYSENGFGLYAVELKASKMVVGMCGLIKRNFLPDADIGFAFLPQFSGKGFGFESATAVLKLAKEKFLLTKISAVTLPENSVSINLIKKLNMQLEKTIIFPGETKEDLLFGLTLV